MDGIEKITAKIAADAQAEIGALTAQAQKEAADITAGFQAQAEALRRDLEAKGGKAAAEREERMASVAQLDCRKAELEAKQALLDRAFDRALEKLCSLKDADYIELLAQLIAQASATGRENVVFSQADRARVGERAVKQANELLAQRKSAARLALAEDTRPIQGGFILREGKVEVNCAFETLVRLQRTEMAGEVAKVLFGGNS